MKHLTNLTTDRLVIGVKLHLIYEPRRRAAALGRKIKALVDQIDRPPRRAFDGKIIIEGKFGKVDAINSNAYSAYQSIMQRMIPYETLPNETGHQRALRLGRCTTHVTPEDPVEEQRRLDDLVQHYPLEALSLWS